MPAEISAGTVSIRFVGRDAGLGAAATAQAARLGTLNKSAGNVAGGLASLSANSLTASTAIRSLGAASVGTTGILIGLGLAARAVFQTFLGYEDAMLRVQAITGATEAELAPLEERIRSIAVTTRFTATEVAQGAVLLSQAGFTLAETNAALEPVLNLAAAGNIDLARSATIVAGTLRAFNFEADQAQRVVDGISKTAARSATNVDQIGNALTYASQVAGIANVPFEELLVLFGLLGDRFLRSSQGGTAVRRVLSGLLNPSREAAKQMEDLGIEVQYLNDGSLDLIGTLVKVGEAGADLGQLFDIFRERGAPAVASVIDASAERLAGLRSEIRQSSGFAQRFRQVIDSGLTGALKRLLSAFQDLAITLAQFLAPIVTSIVDAFSAIARLVTRVVDAVLNNPLGAFVIDFLSLLVDFAAGIIETITYVFDLFVGLLGDFVVGPAATAFLGWLREAFDLLRFVGDFFLRFLGVRQGPSARPPDQAGGGRTPEAEAIRADASQFIELQLLDAQLRQYERIVRLRTEAGEVGKAAAEAELIFAREEVRLRGAVLTATKEGVEQAQANLDAFLASRADGVNRLTAALTGLYETARTNFEQLAAANVDAFVRSQQIEAGLAIAQRYNEERLESGEITREEFEATRLLNEELARLHTRALSATGDARAEILATIARMQAGFDGLVETLAASLVGSFDEVEQKVRDISAEAAALNRQFVSGQLVDAGVQAAERAVRAQEEAGEISASQARATLIFYRQSAALSNQVATTSGEARAQAVEQLRQHVESFEEFVRIVGEAFGFLDEQQEKQKEQSLVLITLAQSFAQGLERGILRAVRQGGKLLDIFKRIGQEILGTIAREAA